MDGMSRSVLEMYQYGVSRKGISKQLGVSEYKIRKILTSAGIVTSELGGKILSLRDEGKSVEEIAKHTGMTKNAVLSYLPYIKGAYNTDSPSTNALRIRASRSKKKK